MNSIDDQLCTGQREKVVYYPNANAHIDRLDLIESPEDLSLVPFITAPTPDGQDDNLGYPLVFRTKTEGKSAVVQVPRGFWFKDHPKTVYKYVQWKGVAMTLLPGIKSSKWGPGTAHIEMNPKNGSYPGFEMVSNVEGDDIINEYLVKRGLRSRRFIKSWDMPDDAQFLIEGNIIPYSEIADLLPEQAVISAWAIRCRDRFQGIFAEFEEIDPEFPRRMMRRRINFKTCSPSDVPSSKAYSYHDLTLEEDNNPPVIDEKRREYIVDKLREFARVIIFAAKDDEESGLAELSRKYANLILDLQTLDKFWVDYLNTIVPVLAKQMAIYEGAGAVNGMLNHQNFTLLGEFVDHDVTLINGKSLIRGVDGLPEFVEPTNLALFKLQDRNFDARAIKVLSESWEAVTKLVSGLCRYGIINITEDGYVARPQFVDMLLESFLSTFLTTLAKQSENSIDSFRKKLEANYNVKKVTLGEFTDVLYTTEAKDYLLFMLKLRLVT